MAGRRDESTADHSSVAVPMEDRPGGRDRRGNNQEVFGLVNDPIGAQGTILGRCSRCNWLLKRRDFEEGYAVTWPKDAAVVIADSASVHR